MLDSSLIRNFFWKGGPGPFCICRINSLQPNATNV